MRVHEHIYMSTTAGRVYLVEGRDGLVMIDCFTAEGIREALRQFAEEDGLDLSRLRALLLTHMHYDHAGGAAYVRARYRVPVICHRLDAEPIARHDRQMTAADIPWAEVVEPMPACPIDYAIEDGDLIAVGDLQFRVVHLPGHTRGGVAYLWEGHLFTGDTMFPNGGIGWSDVHWGSNLPDHAESIRRIAELRPKRIYGGHGDPADYAPEATDTAMGNVQKLVQAGLPSGVSARMPRRSDDAPERTIHVEGIPENPECAPEDRPSQLHRAVLYEVRSGNLRGAIRPQGAMHGLILSGERDVPITRPLAATMNLEHYCAQGRAGAFVPRTEVAQTHWADDRSVTVYFAPHPEWALTSTVKYIRRDDAAFDILFSFAFERDYPKFEAFIASYFWGERIPYLVAGGECFRPHIERGQQLFFPRDDDARAQVNDGRWEFLRRGDLFAEADQRTYDAAMTIHWDEQTGWAFLQMVDPHRCAAVSVNTFAYAQDFSLIGRDVRAGERIEVCARVAYVKLDAPEQAMEVYRAFLAELTEEGR